MKKKIKIILLAALFSSVNAYVPFNPKLTTKGLPEEFELFDETTKKKVTVQKGELSVGNKSYPGARKKDGSIQLQDKSNNYVNKQLKQLVDWDTDDKKKLLYRPWVFYDVMGMTEWKFQSILYNNKMGIEYFPILEAMKNNGEDSVKKSDFKAEIAAFPGREKLLGSKFEQESVKQLQSWWNNNKNKFNAKQPGSIFILDGYKIYEGDSNDYWNQLYKKKLVDSQTLKSGKKAALKYTDIRYQQENNPKSTFQIASNFNCLEGGMGKPDTKLESMQHSAVQGENATLSAMGGAIVRKYVIDPADRDLLSLTGIQTNISGRAQPFNPKNLSLNSLAEKVKVGVHQGVVVTSGYAQPYFQGEEDERSKYLFDNHIVSKGRDPLFVFNSYIPDAKIRINQIFTAALDLVHDPLLSDGGIKKYGAVAQKILDGMYEGTILATAKLMAEKAANNRLFLTLVGAGAFGNQISWILDALNTDLIKDVIARTGMEVIIVLYPDLRKDRGIDDKAKHESMTFGNKKLDEKGEKNSQQIQKWADLMNKDIAKDKDIKKSKEEEKEELEKEKKKQEEEKKKKLEQEKLKKDTEEKLKKQKEEEKKKKEEEKLKLEAEKKKQLELEKLKQEKENKVRLSHRSLSHLANALINME